MKKIKEQEVKYKVTKIIDYPSFRQSTNYSCGVSQTQAALVYCFGSKYDNPESKFFKSLHVTKSGGVDPETIVSFLKSKGCNVESQVLSTQELKDNIDKDQPIIICIQAWGKQKDYSDIYKEGHYVTVIGYNDKGFIFEDPSISTGRGFINYDDLDSRWHDVDKAGKKYNHLGIIIKCHKKYNPDKMEVIEGDMQILNNYLNILNEDFSFISKAFKSTTIKNISNKVKSSIVGNRVNKSMLNTALIPIPSIKQDKINNFLAKYLPNFDNNYSVAKYFFDNKHPTKKFNDTVSSVSAIIISVDNKKSINDSIKSVDKLYSMHGGSGGGAFLLMIIGLFITIGIFSFEGIEPTQKAAAIAVGALLILASVKSLGSN